MTEIPTLHAGEWFFLLAFTVTAIGAALDAGKYSGTRRGTKSTIAAIASGLVALLLWTGNI